ncbi:MAG: prolyl-tRNA synthetase associated domain-containing protein, partial [Acidimicrobiia bacterium]|nr:prolyl-tRNA synthetase associated domain-containing protein [Acidimicrobiia bacterium]
LYTVEDSKALRGDLPGGHCKNLFLRNKKGQMWLVVCPEDRVLDMKDLGERIGAGRVSFGSPERLTTHLGVLPGAVTPFAVMNDADRLVRVVLDEALMAESLLNFHPLVNDQTTSITPGDLMKFLEAVDHRPVVLTLA